MLVCVTPESKRRTKADKLSTLTALSKHLCTSSVPSDEYILVGVNDKDEGKGGDTSRWQGLGDDFAASCFILELWRHNAHIQSGGIAQSETLLQLLPPWDVSRPHHGEYEPWFRMF